MPATPAVARAKADANTFVALLEDTDLYPDLFDFMCEVDHDPDPMRHWEMSRVLAAWFAGMVAYAAYKSGKDEATLRRSLAAKVLADDL